MENIVVDSLALVTALVAIRVSLYTYYKTYDFYRYQELDNMYMRILEIGIEHTILVRRIMIVI